jgi:hypothetical protein
MSALGIRKVFSALLLPLIKSFVFFHAATVSLFLAGK